MKKKEILKTIITIIVSVVLSSGISVYATSTYLFDSCDVSYDNTSSGLNATNVQSSLDELYMHATDYTEIKNYFQNNPTSYFNQNDLRIGANDTSNHESYINFYSSNINRGAIGISNSGDMQIVSKNASGVNGQGILELKGNPVQINGINAYGFTSVQSDSVTMSGGEHANYIVNPSSVIPSGKTIRYAFIQSTLNSAWVFAHLNSISNTRISIGAYNSYTSNVSGHFTVVIIYN